MRYFLLVSCFLASACQIVGPDDYDGTRKATLGKPFTLQADETATFSESLAFHLLELTDSRCPTDAACFWAGDVTLVYSLHNPRSFAVSVPDTIRGYLSPNGNGVLRDTTGAYVVTVEAVWPYPHISRTLPPSRARLVVTPSAN